MKLKNGLAGLGGVFLVVVLIFASFAAVGAFIRGTAWASTKLLPWFSGLSVLSLAVVVLVLLPLAVPRVTRGFASAALFVASYVFGATLWMEGLLLTLALWGYGAVFIGLFMAGVGVVPIAMVATLLKGMWSPLVELVGLTILMVASRLGAIALVASRR